MSKNDYLEVSALADPKEKSGKIWFIHSDGKEHCFYFCTNVLSGSVLCAFDNSAPDVDPGMAYIRSVFRDIKKKAKVVREVGYTG